jgi:hypothetical protein
MPKQTNCIVEGCTNTSHAKGYCRRHYGQIWRRGTIYNETPKDQTTAPESGMRRDDRLKTLEREFKKAQQMYEVVVGFQGRIKWRREMEAVQHEIRAVLESEESENLESNTDSDYTLESTDASAAQRENATVLSGNSLQNE